MLTTRRSVCDIGPEMALTPPLQKGVELPRHTGAFRKRRGTNWLTLGFTYAAMYTARYNFPYANKALSDTYGFDKTSIGAIISAASLIYGVSAVLNGVIADKIGGRRAMLIGACGDYVLNLVFGAGAYLGF